MKRLVTGFIASLTLFACGGRTEPAPQSSAGETQGKASVRLQFGWIPDAHQAGFWVAQERGFYAEEGLEVELLPGGVDASPARAVAISAADIGQISGIEQLLAARESGLEVMVVAAIHRESPHALISLKNPIAKPTDLRGKRVAVAFGDAAEIHLKSLLKGSGIELNEVELVPFRFALQPLVEGEVDAVTGFSTDQPITLESQGLKPTVLAYRDFGIHRYGYCLIVRAGADLATIASFLRASRRGWEETFADPQSAAAFLARRFPGDLETDVELKKIEQLRPIMLTETGDLASWIVEPDLLRGTREAMLSAGLLKSEVSLDGAWKNP